MGTREYHELFDAVIDGAVARVRQEVERKWTAKGAARPGDLPPPQVYRAMCTFAAAHPGCPVLPYVLSVGPSGVRLNSLPADFNQESYDALIASYLAAKGVDADAELPRIPLHIVLNEREMDAALLLLARADDPLDWRQRIDSRKSTALHLAARFGWLQVVEALLSPPHSIPLDALDRDGSTPLALAATLGHAAVLRCLLQHLPEPGRTLEHALANGALRPLRRWAPLPLGHSAICDDHVEVIKMLVDEFGEDVFRPQREGESLATLALHYSSIRIVRYIVETRGFVALEAVCAAYTGSPRPSVLKLACDRKRVAGEDNAVERRIHADRLPLVRFLAGAGVSRMPVGVIFEAADAAEDTGHAYVAEYLRAFVERHSRANVAEAELLGELEAEEQRTAAKKSKKKKKKAKAKANGKEGSAGGVVEATAALAAVAVGDTGGNDAKAPPPAPATAPSPSSAPLDPEEAFLRAQAPPHNLCPLSGALLTEAVIGSDGVTYQREALERWIEAARQAGKSLVSPSTGEPMQELCISNQAVRSLVRGYAEAKRKEWAAMNK